MEKIIKYLFFSANSTFAYLMQSDESGNSFHTKKKFKEDEIFKNNMKVRRDNMINNFSNFSNLNEMNNISNINNINNISNLNNINHISNINNINKIQNFPQEMMNKVNNNNDSEKIKDEFQMNQMKQNMMNEKDNNFFMPFNYKKNAKYTKPTFFFNMKNNMISPDQYFKVISSCLSSSEEGRKENDKSIKNY